MKTPKDVENIAEQTAEKLGEGWSAQGTVLGAQLTGPRGACIRMNLDGELVEVFADNVPKGSGVPEGTFPIDRSLIGYFVCNALHPKYMRYLDDEREEQAERERWHERTQQSIKDFAASAGATGIHLSGGESAMETTFLAHGCRVSVEARYQSEDTIRIAVPARLDLGYLTLDCKETV